MRFDPIGVVALGLVGAVAFRHFGYFDGIGVLAAVWLLMPFRPVRQ